VSDRELKSRNRLRHGAIRTLAIPFATRSHSDHQLRGSGLALFIPGLRQTRGWDPAEPHFEL